MGILTQIIADIHTTKEKLIALEKEYAASTKGKAYQNIYDGLNRKLNSLENKLTKVGREHSINFVEYDIVEPGLHGQQFVKKYRQYFSGLEKEECLLLVKIENPKAYNLMVKSIAVGVKFSR